METLARTSRNTGITQSMTHQAEGLIDEDSHAQPKTAVTVSIIGNGATPTHSIYPPTLYYIAETSMDT